MSFRKFYQSTAALSVLFSSLPAFAVTQLAPDPDARPSSGVQHPASLPVFKAAAASSSLDFRKELAKDYGNTSWGGGYRIYEHLRAPTASYQSINFDYDVRGRIFGKQVEGFRVHGSSWNPKDSERASRLHVVVLGKEIFAEKKESSALTGETKVAFNKAPFDQSLAKVSKTFTLGPIPVTVSADLRGQMGVNVTTRAYRTSASSSGATLEGTAFGELYGRMSAGVGIPFASAGIRGAVTLTELRVGKDIAVERKAAKRVDYRNNFKVVLETLQGQLDLYASLLGADYEKKILDWNGYSFTYDFAKQQGAVTFQ